MITLVRRKNDPASDELEQKLTDLVLAYKSEDADPGSTSTLPYIKENGKIISGKENIETWLQELEKELSWQRSLSGDGCYIDPDTGETC